MGVRPPRVNSACWNGALVGTVRLRAVHVRKSEEGGKLKRKKSACSKQKMVKRKVADLDVWGAVSSKGDARRRVRQR